MVLRALCFLLLDFSTPCHRSEFGANRSYSELIGVIRSTILTNPKSAEWCPAKKLRHFVSNPSHSRTATEAYGRLWKASQCFGVRPSTNNPQPSTIQAPHPKVRPQGGGRPQGPIRASPCQSVKSVKSVVKTDPRPFGGPAARSTYYQLLTLTKATFRPSAFARTACRWSEVRNISLSSCNAHAT